MSNSTSINQESVEMKTPLRGETDGLAAGDGPATDGTSGHFTSENAFGATTPAAYGATPHPNYTNEDLDDKMKQRSLKTVCLVMLVIVALVVILAIVMVTRSRDYDGNGDNENPVPPPTFPRGLIPPVEPFKGYPCSSNIFCKGDILKTMELAAVYPDSKTFVDMPLKVGFWELMNAWDQLTSFGQVTPDKAALTDFLDTYFHPAGYEVQPYTPSDFPQNPQFAKGISKSADLQIFGGAVHDKWHKLVRIFNFTGLCRSCHSSLPLPFPFVVPGGRFREFYYWDSFWILQGLFVSQMTTTAGHIIDNMLFLIDNYGFVPNGARAYYLDRSQPPVLTLMVSYTINQTWPLLMNKTAHPDATTEEFNSQVQEAAAWLQDVSLESVHTRINVLVQEMSWWSDRLTLSCNTSSDQTNFTIAAGVSSAAKGLNRYCANVLTPRPESYLEDYNTHEEMLKDPQQATRSAKDLYSNIASGAETGMDYSTRWFDPAQVGGSQMTSIVTNRIVPVDLNAILLRDEQLLGEFYDIIARSQYKTKPSTAVHTRYIADAWKAKAKDRQESMISTLWQQDNCTFLDLNLASGQPHQAWYASNMVPLWVPSIAREIHDMQRANIQSGGTVCTWDVNLDGQVTGALDGKGGVVNYKKYFLPLMAGGIPTSLQQSGQQWDYPNAWAPCQWFIIQALGNFAELDGDQLANYTTRAGPGPKATTAAGELQWKLVQDWVMNNFCAWKATGGYMIEKYSAADPGVAGHGGEYKVQDGFGWTNGVILQLLEQYGDVLAKPTCPPPTPKNW